MGAERLGILRLQFGGDDIVGVFFVNPPQHDGAVKAEQLRKYAVIFLLGADQRQRRHQASPAGQEIQTLTYAANINVVVPAAAVRETLKNAPLAQSGRGDKSVYTVKLPPGEIRVIDVDGFQ